MKRILNTEDITNDKFYLKKEGRYIIEELYNPKTQTLNYVDTTNYEIYQEFTKLDMNFYVNLVGDGVIDSSLVELYEMTEEEYNNLIMVMELAK